MKFHRWKIINRYPDDPVNAILKNRKIESIKNFLNPNYDLLPKAQDFPGLKNAVKIILKAKTLGKKVGLFMDYDADGICGGAIIFKALENLKIKTIYYIPKREEGYGLSTKAVDHFKAEKVDILITIDCGIRNNKEIDYAKKLDMHVIVVDHHQIDKLPNADALVHPLISKNNKLKFKDYSGGGVAFILAKELYGNSGQEKWLLDLATISSVADVVTLKDVNRAIVKFGLIVIKKTKNLGLKKLIETAGLKIDSLSVYDIGFMLAPRINAAGRISSPQKSFELLISKDKDFVNSASLELEKLNKERQQILEDTQKEAVEMVIKKKLYRDKIIAIYKEGWNEGIIGLVASRLVEKFYRPAIVLAKKGDFLKGSARSISGIDITNLISKTQRNLLTFGGHSQAAGLSLKFSQLNSFFKTLKKFANKKSDKYFERILTIDAVLRLDQINIDLINKIEDMEPFGPGNPRVIFGFEDVVVDNFQAVGKDKNHYRFSVCKNGESKKCIAFRAQENGFEIKNKDVISIAFTIKNSYWQGTKKIDLIVEDVEKK